MVFQSIDEVSKPRGLSRNSSLRSSLRSKPDTTPPPPLRRTMTQINPPTRGSVTSNKDTNETDLLHTPTLNNKPRLISKETNEKRMKPTNSKPPTCSSVASPSSLRKSPPKLNNIDVNTITGLSVVSCFVPKTQTVEENYFKPIKSPHYDHTVDDTQKAKHFLHVKEDTNRASGSLKPKENKVITPSLRKENSKEKGKKSENVIQSPRNQAFTIEFEPDDKCVVYEHHKAGLKKSPVIFKKKVSEFREPEKSSNEIKESGETNVGKNVEEFDTQKSLVPDSQDINSLDEEIVEDQNHITKKISLGESEIQSSIIEGTNKSSLCDSESFSLSWRERVLEMMDNNIVKSPDLDIGYLDNAKACSSDNFTDSNPCNENVNCVKSGDVQPNELELMVKLSNSTSVDKYTDIDQKLFIEQELDAIFLTNVDKSNLEKKMGQEAIQESNDNDLKETSKEIMDHQEIRIESYNANSLLSENRIIDYCDGTTENKYADEKFENNHFSDADIYFNEEIKISKALSEEEYLEKKSMKNEPRLCYMEETGVSYVAKIVEEIISKALAEDIGTSNKESEEDMFMPEETIPHNKEEMGVHKVDFSVKKEISKTITTDEGNTVKELKDDNCKADSINKVDPSKAVFEEDEDTNKELEEEMAKEETMRRYNEEEINVYDVNNIVKLEYNNNGALQNAANDPFVGENISYSYNDKGELCLLNCHNNIYKDLKTCESLDENYSEGNRKNIDILSDSSISDENFFCADQFLKQNKEVFFSKEEDRFLNSLDEISENPVDQNFIDQKGFEDELCFHSINKKHPLPIQISDSSLQKNLIDKNESKNYFDIHNDKIHHSEKNNLLSLPSQSIETPKDRILQLAGQEFVLMTEEGSCNNFSNRAKSGGNCNSAHCEEEPPYCGAYKPNTYCQNTHKISDENDTFSDIFSNLKSKIGGVEQEKLKRDRGRMASWEELSQRSTSLDNDQLSECNSLDCTSGEDYAREFIFFQPNDSYCERIPFQHEAFNVGHCFQNNTKDNLSNNSFNYDSEKYESSRNESPVSSSVSITTKSSPPLSSPRTPFYSKADKRKDGFVLLNRPKNSYNHKSSTLLPPIVKSENKNSKNVNTWPTHEKSKNGAHFSKVCDNQNECYPLDSKKCCSSDEFNSDTDWDLTDSEVYEEKKKSKVVTRTTKTVHNHYYEHVEYSRESNEFRTVKTSVYPLPFSSSDPFREKKFKLPFIESKENSKSTNSTKTKTRSRAQKESGCDKLPYLKNFVKERHECLTRSSGADGDIGKPETSKFCHECGAKYPIAGAKFCCNCGMRRITL